MYVYSDRVGMSGEAQEYLIVPWGDSDCETHVCTVELPSRELIAQLEVPTPVLERMADLAERNEISLECALAERLEMNRARVSLLAASAVEETSEVREYLTAAREYLSGVETLDTDDLEADIERVWQRELESV